VLAARTREWSEADILDHAEQFSEPAFHAALHRAVAEVGAGGTPSPRTVPDAAAASTRLGA
jgi:hypothetical protein